MPVQPDRPGVGQRAEQRPGNRLVAGTAQPDEADDLALPQPQIERADAARRETRQLEDRLAQRLAGLHRRPGPSADDALHQLFGRGMLHAAHPDHQAIAQDRDAVGDAKNLVEPVADIDHPDAAVAQRAQRGEQPLDLVGRQRGGRLVQHQELAVDGKRAGDRDQRLLGPAQRLDAGRRVEVARDPRQRLGGEGLDRRPFDQAAPALEAEGERDVLGDRHPFDQAEILVDEGDLLALAKARRAMLIRLAVDQDLPRIGLVDAAQDLDQGGFAGAVLAEQRDDLAPSDGERDVPQGVGAAEMLVDPVEEQAPLLPLRHPLLPLSRTVGVN